jgi:hypothetical protein
VAYFALVYASLVPVFYANRYHLPLVPAAAAFAALALALPGAWLQLPARRAGKGRRMLAAGLGMALVAVATSVAVRGSIEDARWLEGQVPVELPAMARALRADWHGPGAPRLIARKPHMAYYTDAVAIAFQPLDSLEALARYAHAERADYLYISWPEAEMRPLFAFLLVPAFAPAGLDLVAASPNGHAVLYHVRPEFGQVLPAWYPREWEWRSAEGMTRVRPNDPEMWLRTAMGRHARRDYAGALDALGLALRMHPGWGDAYLELANLEAEQGNDGPALEDYDHALAGGATSARLFLAWAVVLQRNGQGERAQAMLQRYVALTHDTSVLRAFGGPPQGGTPGR